MITKQDIDNVMGWCFKNNTIEFKNTGLKLAILDGGWVNVIKLKEFLESIKENAKKETTFQETYDFLQNNGWTKISINEYLIEKKYKKYLTARIGLYGFFKLNKSNEEIMKEKKQ